MVNFVGAHNKLPTGKVLELELQKLTLPSEELKLIPGLSEKVCIIKDIDKIETKILSEQKPNPTEVIEYAHSYHTWEHRINLLASKLGL